MMMTTSQYVHALISKNLQFLIGCAVATLGLWNTEYVSEQTRRTCDRCHKVFNVDETGIQAANEGSCVYHSGKKTSQQGTLSTYF